MILFNDLKKVTELHGAEINEAVTRAVNSGWYLHGRETEAFEQAYARYIGTEHAIGMANGLDALRLIFRALIELGRLRPGDEVIVPANTYIASILAVSEFGLTPVLVEPDPVTMQLDGNLLKNDNSPHPRRSVGASLWSVCIHACYRRSVSKLRIDADRGQRAGSRMQV